MKSLQKILYSDYLPTTETIWTSLLSARVVPTLQKFKNTVFESINLSGKILYPYRIPSTETLWTSRLFAGVVSTLKKFKNVHRIGIRLQEEYSLHTS